MASYLWVTTYQISEKAIKYRKGTSETILHTSYLETLMWHVLLMKLDTEKWIDTTTVHPDIQRCSTIISMLLSSYQLKVLLFVATMNQKDHHRGNFVELLDVLGGYSHDLRSFLDDDRITYTSH